SATVSQIGQPTDGPMPEASSLVNSFQDVASGPIGHRLNRTTEPVQSARRIIVRIVFRPSSASPSHLVFMRPPPMAVAPRLKLELPPKALPRLQEPLAQAGGCQKPSEAAPAAQKG